MSLVGDIRQKFRWRRFGSAPFLLIVTRSSVGISLSELVNPCHTRKEMSDWPLFPGEETVAGPFRLGTENTGVRRMASFGSFLLALVCAIFGLLLLRVNVAAHGALFCALILFAGGLWGLFGGIRDREFMVSDRRVLLREGKRFRTMHRNHIGMMRIHWWRSPSYRGDLELVVATPFGPLRRTWRMILRGVAGPDQIVATLLDYETNVSTGFSSGPLVERLFAAESLRWSTRPQGWMIGVREIATMIFGLVVGVIGVIYIAQTYTIIFDLQVRGFLAGTLTWGLLVSAVVISGATIVGAAIYLLWFGSIRAYRMGLDSEYLLTNVRLLIRRGRNELTIPRQVIVGSGSLPIAQNLQHIFVLIDGPDARALGGAKSIGPSLPSRESVPPVLFEVSRDLVFSDVLANAAE